jgi:hypothetical protein
MELLDDAVEALVASGRAEEALPGTAPTTSDRLYKAILPDPAGEELQADCAPHQGLGRQDPRFEAPGGYQRRSWGRWKNSWIAP